MVLMCLYEYSASIHVLSGVPNVSTVRGLDRWCRPDEDDAFRSGSMEPVPDPSEL
jgi:hypothetical protein